MAPNEIWEVHSRSKEKINCIYVRANGKAGHCYIDPSKPLRRSYNEHQNFGYNVIDKTDFFMAAKVEGFRVGVFKQANNVEIFVKPENLWIHSGKVEKVIKVLYG